MSKLLFNRIKQTFGVGQRLKGKYRDINPEDIFLDSANLPGFEQHTFEGRLEKPVGNRTFTGVKVLLSIIVVLLVGKLWSLSVWNGEVYAQISENNRLEETLVFANRGAILDRNGVELAGNAIKSDIHGFSARQYSSLKGLAHLVGYIKYPQTDRDGFYYEKEYKAKEGVERAYDELLRGKNGEKLVETDVRGEVTSESVVDKPQDGQTITLSVDAKVTEVMYKAIENLARSSRFVGGAGVIMDVRTGEILALTSYPEYDQTAMTVGITQATFSAMLKDPGNPFLNRVVGGLYTPGSIVKPIVALGALNENVISPDKQIFSSGSISVPNPYDPSKPSVFRDWKAHGWTDMAEALAVSSDTYFYAVGGGFGDQKGMGISLIDKYFKMFGLEEKTSIPLLGEVGGIIATPEWKKEKFNGDIWRLGDTYITSIGQYGTQVTPINAVRFIAAVANGGTLLKPSLLLGGEGGAVERKIDLPLEDWRVVREGMREGVEYGTSMGVNVPYVTAAGKTGTAEIGSGKSYVHSWSAGFFPFENPHYAWIIIMEKGPSTNTVGATSVMRQVFDWIALNAPQYFENR